MCAYRTVNGGFEIEANILAISISVASYYLISWYIDVRIQHTFIESRFALCKGVRVPESGKFWLVESGILGFGIQNTAQGIRNPTEEWNPESEFH